MSARWHLSLIGMGMGSPAHLTRQGEQALRRLELLLLPDKGEDKAELAAARLRLLQAVRPDFDIGAGGGLRVARYAVPPRDGADAADTPRYLDGVRRWHDALARAWAQALREQLPHGGRAGVLIWGDPALFDSSMRIARRVARELPLELEVVPGISALQALAAAHAVPLNELASPVLITTGRRLRQQGCPPDVPALAVMLDGGTAFETLPDPHAWHIWWGAYLGLPQQTLDSGPLAQAGPRIARARAALRQAHGWILDIYLLKRCGADDY
jgi:precorrin-6A synthase